MCQTICQKLDTVGVSKKEPFCCITLIIPPYSISIRQVHIIQRNFKSRFKTFNCTSEENFVAHLKTFLCETEKIIHDMTKSLKF